MRVLPDGRTKVSFLVVGRDSNPLASMERIQALLPEVAASATFRVTITITFNKGDDVSENEIARMAGFIKYALSDDGLTVESVRLAPDEGAGRMIKRRLLRGVGIFLIVYGLWVSIHPGAALVFIGGLSWVFGNCEEPKEPEDYDEPAEHF